MFANVGWIQQRSDYQWFYNTEMKAKEVGENERPIVSPMQCTLQVGVVGPGAKTMWPYIWFPVERSCFLCFAYSKISINHNRENEQKKNLIAWSKISKIK